jgi:hypothetical protein
MKRKKHSAPKSTQLQIRYDEKGGGWVVDGAPKQLRPFASKWDAENYCIKELHQCPIMVTPHKTEHQDLPHNSVWTGAPWDKSFKDLKIK